MTGGFVAPDRRADPTFAALLEQAETDDHAKLVLADYLEQRGETLTVSTVRGGK